jgi:hypothetical protein
VLFLKKAVVDKLVIYDQSGVKSVTDLGKLVYEEWTWHAKELSGYRVGLKHGGLMGCVVGGAVAVVVIVVVAITVRRRKEQEDAIVNGIATVYTE